MFKIWENLATASMFEATPEGWIVVDVRDFSDISKETDMAIERIRLIGGLIANGWKVVIRCVAGINRSNVFACATMCMLQPEDDLDDSWNKHWELIREKVPRAQPTMELYDTVKKALWGTKRFKYWRDSKLGGDGL